MQASSSNKSSSYKVEILQSNRIIIHIIVLLQAIVEAKDAHVVESSKQGLFKKLYLADKW